MDVLVKVSWLKLWEVESVCNTLLADSRSVRTLDKAACFLSLLADARGRVQGLFARRTELVQ